jgi:hypothetical protein
MPHLFANRSRQFALLKPADHPFHYVWQWVSAFLYIIGGILLVVGSVFFLPKYDDYEVEGTYMFLVASILYLWVSTHDIIEVIKAPREEDNNDLILELMAGFSYAIGAILFIVGSIFFLPGNTYNEIAGAWLFIMGSVLFVVGACVNAKQIWSSPDTVSAQIANLIAVNFVMGSTFYLSASIPYLFDFQSESDANTEYKYIATIYIIGSVNFVIAGFLDMKRFHWVSKLPSSEHNSKSKVELLPAEEKHESQVVDVPPTTMEQK